MLPARGRGTAWTFGTVNCWPASSKFARDLVQQYYYVSGIKEALATSPKESDG